MKSLPSHAIRGFLIARRKLVGQRVTLENQIRARVLTDRGTEYCGNPEHHEYELYLAIENIDHSRTKTKGPADEWNL